MSFVSKITAAILTPIFTQMSQRRLPQTAGTIKLRGLEKAVSVQRDGVGIPHIHAESRQDLFFAQGFVHAQDRLWQMEINRRAATGRLSELVGPLGLPTDRLTRTLGFTQLAHHSWHSLPSNLQDDVTAYTAGVNRFLEQSDTWPLEFTLLRHTPEPWSVLDSIAFSRLQLWGLSYGWAGELVRAQLIETVGKELAAELEPNYPDRNPITLPNGIEFNKLRLDGMLEAAIGPFLMRGVEGTGRGSNGWVVAASRSETGRALLCNDMHLPLTTPSIWYVNHLQARDGYHVTGVSQPGLPYVLVGHNEHIAWGATLSFCDVEDVFIEQFRDATQQQYRFGNEWRDANVRDEKIIVRNGADHIERVVTTHHGPLIGHLLDANSDQHAHQSISLASMALQPDSGFAGFPALNIASNWDEFVEAVAEIQSPPLNLIYADQQDNIGYYVSGKVPIRAQGEGLIPAPGWSGTHEWIDVVPFEEMPHALNPKSGVIVTCNNRVVDDQYPHFLGSVWVSGNRAARVESLLNAYDPVTLECCRAIHRDLMSLPALELIELLDQLSPTDEDARLALSLLSNWNGWLGVDTIGGAVYRTFLKEVATILFEPHFGTDFLHRFLGLGINDRLAPINEFYGYWPDALIRMIQADESGWLPGPFGRSAILERGLSQTIATLRKTAGPDPQDWQWGGMHQIQFEHVMGRQPPLDQIFSPGPFPIGGDTDTVMQTATRPGDNHLANAFSVSYRQILDVGNWDAAEAMFVPGQSGHLASDHYADLIDSWRDGKYFQLAWTQHAVDRNSREQLQLEPNQTN